MQKLCIYHPILSSTTIKYTQIYYKTLKFIKTHKHILYIHTWPHLQSGEMKTNVKTQYEVIAA